MAMPHNPRWADQMTASMTLRQAIRTHDLALEAANRSTSVRDGYSLVARRYLDFLKLAEIVEPTLAHLTPELVRAFVLTVRDQTTLNERTGTVRSRGPRTIQGHVMALKSLAHFLVDEGVLDHNPLAAVKLPKVPKTVVDPFTAEEVRRLLDAVGLRPMATRNRAILFFLFATGVRASELAGLTLANLDLKACSATIMGKGSKERIVRFDRITSKYLALYVAERPNVPIGRGRVFVSQTGRPITRGAIFQMVQKLGNDAGVDDAHPHRARHTFACAFLEAHPGALFHLQELLGHESLEMVRRYAKIARSREVLSGPDVIETLGLTGRRK